MALKVLHLMEVYFLEPRGILSLEAFFLDLFVILFISFSDNFTLVLVNFFSWIGFPFAVFLYTLFSTPLDF